MIRRLLTAAGLILLLGLPATPAVALAEENDPPTTSSPESQTGIGIRLLDIPAATQTDPRARSYIVDNLPPGTTIERRVQVQNNTTSTQTVKVYASAARIKGNSFIGEDGATKNELTTWISVDRPKLNMAAGESANILVTISVPENAAEGEQYAAIWAEVRSPSDSDTNIVSASRVGIRVYLSVGAGNGPAVDFQASSLTGLRTAGGKAEAVATVLNTGGRALDIIGSLSLSDGPSGLSAGPFNLDQTITIAPGESSQVKVTMGSSLPDGPWAARLHLSSGLVSHETSGQLTFRNAKPSERVQPDSGSNVLLITSVGALILAAIASGIWLGRRRRRSTTHA